MNLEYPILCAGALSTLVPVMAVLIRGRSRAVMKLVTLCAAVVVSAHLLILVRLVLLGPCHIPNPWVYALVASTFPVLMAGYLLSMGFGRDRPEESFRECRRPFILMGIAGLVLLCFVRRPAFVIGYDWADGRGTIHLGAVGKAYLSYLLIGIVAIGYNFEKTYRIAPTEHRYRIRLPFLGLFSLLGFLTFVLATGMVYSSIGLGKLIVTSLPVTIVSLTVAYGYLRGAMTDVTAPVSRNVVYSSFTALAAALLVIAIGAAAQVATWTRWSPDQILIVAFAFLAVLVGVLLLFSNRFQRNVRRYIDRNFYVNRYDYRTQWSNVTESLALATTRDEVLDHLTSFLQDVFMADGITVALQDEMSSEILPIRGRGAVGDRVTLSSESPLFQRFCLERKTLLLDRKADDFTYIPIYAESDRWLEATASQVISPLLVGECLIGTIGLERRDDRDPFTFEDVALLDNIAGHVAATLRSVLLASEIAERREMALVSQWSSMLLHDLKNYLAPLRLVTGNLVEHKEDPEIISACARDIDHVAGRMEKLIHTLSELRNNKQLGRETVCPNQLVHDALSTIHASRRPTITVVLDLMSHQKICGDGNMLRRVLENLLTNAIDAMNGGGTLSVMTTDRDAKGVPQICIEVGDTGCGMSESFIRERLFHPFATTKKTGLGLGLYQCRTIVQAHGGELTVRTELGKGSIFRVSLSALNSHPRMIGPVERAGVPDALAR